MVKEFENEFSKTFCKVNYLSEHNALVVAWYGYTTKLQVETVLLWIEEQMQKTPCQIIVNDCSEILSVWGDLIDWISHVWAHKVTSLGLEKIIHIAKPNSFGYKIGSQLQATLINQIEFSSFESRADTINWLENSKKSVNP